MHFKVPFILFVLSPFFLQAQIGNFPANTLHAVSSSVGYDHNAFTINIGYDRYLPMAKSAVFSEIGQGTSLLGSGNFRVQAGVKSWIGTSGRFLLQSQLSTGLIRAVNNAGQYNSVALWVEASPGLSRQWGGMGLNAQFNPVIAAHIHHSNEFKEKFYAGAKDGWYRNTSNNFRLGVYVYWLIGKTDRWEINFKAGAQSSGKLDRLIPGLYLLPSVTKKF